MLHALIVVVEIALLLGVGTFIVHTILVNKAKILKALLG